MSSRNEVAERNEAAERLRLLLDDVPTGGEPWLGRSEQEWLTEALAAERALGRAEGSRATVERIRERASKIDYRGPRMIGWDDLRAILDEVANAQEELRTADAKAAR